MHSAGAHSKGEIQVVAQAIRKEELGGRERDVFFGDAQHCFGIILRAVGHIVL